MSYYIKQEDDVKFPHWLQEGLKSNCIVCGSPMLNYYNDSNMCTNRRCSNNFCPAMLAKRFVGMCSILGVKGVGYETGLRIIKCNNLKSHVDCISYVLDEIVSVSLSQFLRIMEFEGVDSVWERVCNMGDYYTLEELYNSYNGEYRYILDQNKEEIVRCSQFFNFLKPKVNKVIDEPIIILHVMITGTPVGFNTKEEYIEIMNIRLQGVIKLIHVKNARSTGVDVLIRENGSVTKGKLAAAQKAGIPILTSEEFNKVLTNIIVEETKKKLNEKG